MTLLPHGDGLPMPRKASTGAAGIDVFAAVSDEVVVGAHAWAVIPTGIALAMPPNIEAQIRARSGLASKHGLFVLNAPGTVDADFRGEIMVILANFSAEDYLVRRGDRIAQLVFQRVLAVEIVEVAALGVTPRGTGGLGSSGR